MDNNQNNSKLKTYARGHRNDSTKAEIRMWCELLRNKKMLGYSFLRQRPIANYIADFFSKDLKLVIEVDGLSHEWEGQFEKDRVRESILKTLGFHVLRFSDDEVMNDIENVNRTIQNFITDWEQRHPPAPFRRGTSES
ncbi:very-short-patch-repair endonuclease [Pedobacter sp. AK013]|uniref:endonuclease domain-containing protein n=1 Tax=Pedobacter sp. AK013 TaxID=2723071 RepID=UPI00160E9254|nr:endonuclease domain-containing protein [Pedobacter sp. AK013]MBB6238575.1 very-short-patch-repair endonuclease [Pedobacter sp. AK013]